MCPDSGLNVPISDKPIVGALTFQGFLTLAGGILMMTSCSMSFYQIFRHATNYTKPGEQRQIIRICLLVPIYSISAFLSIVFYKKHVYLSGIYLTYEACALVAFYALSTYVTESMGVLCSEEGGTKYADFWLSTVISVATLITAMHCLFQFYYQSMEHLEPHKPVLKFMAIKIVVFLTLMQDYILDAIVGKDDQPLGPTDAISYPSLSIGVPNLLLCLEIFGIGILHLYAYPWSPYVLPTSSGVVVSEGHSVEPDSGDSGAKGGPTMVDILPEAGVGYSQGGFLGWTAYLDALNFSDFAIALYNGVFWVFMRYPEQDTRGRK
ncbi:duf300 domain-containing protein [Colletotrichum karsti]|uniref:Duf300 domain-containing protein n=1 Tax=Colletotrichum karsti TaxID=1095194 RepID=A0A9P6LQA2_9PEZI|nr:duf300 domain-containing protein [Colletotrichum karsti]KAF9881416.1 duf300 domain-containing protein [Colletotrichum karsti]